MTRYTLKPFGKDNALVPVTVQIPRGKHRGQTPGAFGGKRKGNQLVEKAITACRA